MVDDLHHLACTQKGVTFIQVSLFLLCTYILQCDCFSSNPWMHALSNQNLKCSSHMELEFPEVIDLNKFRKMVYRELVVEMYGFYATTQQ